MTAVEATRRYQMSLTGARKARARLTEMLTQEISAVPAGANGRRFVIVKHAGQVTKVALKLPTAAKQGIMDGLAAALDKLTALATTVGEAEADDAAAVPPDLGGALRECAGAISALAEQYAPEAAPPVEGEPPPEAAPAEMAAPAAPLLPGQQPAAKALPSPQTTPLNMSEVKDPLTMAPKTMAGIAELFKAVGSEMADVLKAGRKIKGERYKKLSDLHDHLGKLLNELAYDDATGAGDPPAPTKKSAPALADDAARVRALEVQVASLTATIAKGAVDQPRSRGGNENPLPAREPVVFPLDLSADLAKRKRAGR